MLNKSLKTICALLVLGLATQGALANLLINPTRVEFRPSDRTADVTLINTSKFTTTYRLDWVEKKAKAGGFVRRQPDALWSERNVKTIACPSRGHLCPHPPPRRNWQPK